MSRAILILAVFAACGHAPPKPRELDTLEALRRTPQAEQAKQSSPDLVKESDQLQGRSKGAWKQNEMESSRRDALLGWIKLKTAIAIWEQAEAKRRIEAADADKARSDKDFARINKDLTAVNDQIALLDKLSTAKTAAERDKLRAEQEKQKLAAELAQQQQKGEAQNRISDAQLALKTADTVDAKTYAKDQYQAAVDLVARAQSELNSGNVSASITSADMARQKAEAATATAKPEFMKQSEAKDRSARDEALGRDAAALSGVTVRLDKKGDVTRLVLTFGGAFKGKSTNIVPGKDGVLDAVAALLKKYPTYPVQLIGHTDSKGRADANLVISQARAQSVFDAMISRGVEAKRFVVSGKGGTQPVSDNKSAKGRDANNRVEMVFLYQ